MGGLKTKKRDYKRPHNLIAQISTFNLLRLFVREDQRIRKKHREGLEED